MSDEPLLTLRQVADELGLPESTVRYYRDAYLDHIPSVGTGRRRRYPPPAVAVLRSIAEGYAAGRSREAILNFMDGATVPPAATAAPAADEKLSRGRRQPAGISNLELLAAIVDGEREQRDALWQMAKEIVRLTEVLEGQEKVLTEIADHAGVSPALAAAGEAPKALGEGRAAAAGTPRPAAAPPPPAPPRPAPAPPRAPIEPPVARPAPAVAPPVEEPQPVPPWVKVGPPPVEVAAPPIVAPPAPPPPPPPLGAPPAPAAAAPAAAAPPPRASGDVAPASEMERLKMELESERQLVERLREAKVKLEHRVSDAEAELEDRRPRRRSSVLGRILGSEDNP